MLNLCNLCNSIPITNVNKFIYKSKYRDKVYQFCSKECLHRANYYESRKPACWFLRNEVTTNKYDRDSVYNIPILQK